MSTGNGCGTATSDAVSITLVADPEVPTQTMDCSLGFGKAILALLIISGPFYALGQQYPIYSRYIFNMQTVNPAYAGSWQTMGFTALEREQWVGITGHPSTQTFSFQFKKNSVCDVKASALGYKDNHKLIGIGAPK